MAGLVPAIFAPADEARMAGTRPAMTDNTAAVGAYPDAYEGSPAMTRGEGGL